MFMMNETNDKLKTIKRSFRSMMNGPAAHSMRGKGAEYKINWGVSLPQLQKMADEYAKDYDLAISLWKENIRECKILATMIIPQEQMLPEMADIWMEQTQTQELAEIASLKLYQHLPFAPTLAYKWLACDKKYYQIAAYNILGQLFNRGIIPNELHTNELLEHAVAALKGSDLGIKHAVFNCLTRLENLSADYATLVSTKMKSHGIDLW